MVIFYINHYHLRVVLRLLYGSLSMRPINTELMGSMRRTIFCFCFLFTLFTLSTVHAANEIYVFNIDTPSAANGKYIHMGIIDDHDYWKHETQNYYIYYHQFDGGDYDFFWNIDNDTDDAQVYFYSNSNPDDTSPANVISWEASSGTGSPHVSTAAVEPDVTNLNVDNISTPSAANGKYILTGTIYDHDYWKHETQNYYIYYHQYNGGDQNFYWNIDNDFDDTQIYFYSNGNPDDTSPSYATSWNSGSGTGSPTVEVAEEALPEINIKGNGVSIADGDTSPNAGDDTDFGNVYIASGGTANTYTIENIGTEALSLTGSSPYVTITGDTSDFTLTAPPSR
jgi:hypothetical protein